MPGVPQPPGFVRPDPDPGPPAPTLNKSAVFILNDGGQVRYPTRDDYVDRLVAQGLIKSLDDLIANHAQLIGEIFINWVETGQLACVFASVLAKKPRENRWLPAVFLHALKEGDQLPGLVNAELDAAFDSHEAAVLIFPDIRTGQEIVSLLNLLCGDASGRWYWTSTDIDPDPTGELALVGLRWVLQTDKSVNFVLGFADIPTMPLTRRAPFTALFLRITERKRTPEHKEDGRVQVHLADLDSTLQQAVHDRVAEVTAAKRKNYVEPTRSAAARARVAFSLSPREASALCAPRTVVVEKDGDGHGK